MLTVRRNGETIDLKIKPVEYETGEYRLGIWVRDNVQGLGTVTFLTDQSRLARLGMGFMTWIQVFLCRLRKEMYTARVSEISQKDRADLREVWRV